MIWSTLLSLLRTIAWAVLELLPTVVLTPLDWGSISFARGAVSAVVPWSALLGGVGVLLVWMVVCHVYRLVLWILGVLHLSGDSQ